MTTRRIGRGKGWKAPGKQTLKKEVQSNYPALTLVLDDFDPTQFMNNFMVMAEVVKLQKMGKEVEEFSIYFKDRDKSNIDPKKDRRLLSELLKEKSKDIVDEGLGIPPDVAGLKGDLRLTQAITLAAYYEFMKSMKDFQYANTPKARKFYATMMKSGRAAGLTKEEVQERIEQLQKTAQLVTMQFKKVDKTLLDKIKVHFNSTEYDYREDEDEDDLDPLKQRKALIRAIKHNMETDIDKKIEGEMAILSDKAALEKFRFPNPNNADMPYTGFEAFTRLLRTKYYSLKHTAMILNAIKEARGGIGPQGRAFLKEQMGHFKDDLEQAKQKNDIDALILLREDFRSAFKLDKSGNPVENSKGLRSHFEKNVSNPLKRVFLYLFGKEASGERSEISKVFKSIDSNIYEIMGLVKLPKKKKEIKHAKEQDKVMQQERKAIAEKSVPTVQAEPSGRPRTRTFLPEPPRPGAIRTSRTPASPLTPKVAETHPTKAIHLAPNVVDVPKGKAAHLAPNVVDVPKGKAAPLKPLGSSHPFESRKEKMAPDIRRRVGNLQADADPRKEYRLQEQPRHPGKPHTTPPFQQGSKVRSQVQLHDERRKAEEREKKRAEAEAKARAESARLRRQHAKRPINLPRGGVTEQTPPMHPNHHPKPPLHPSKPKPNPHGGKT